MINIGESIRYQREIAKKSTYDIEKETGLSNENQSRWENGKVIPGIDKCIILADFYGITLDELVGRNTNSPEPQGYDFEYQHGDTHLHHKEKK